MLLLHSSFWRRQHFACLSIVLNQPCHLPPRHFNSFFGDVSHWNQKKFMEYITTIGASWNMLKHLRWAESFSQSPVPLCSSMPASNCPSIRVTTSEASLIDWLQFCVIFFTRTEANRNMCDTERSQLAENRAFGDDQLGKKRKKTRLWRAVLSILEPSLTHLSRTGTVASILCKHQGQRTLDSCMRVWACIIYNCAWSVLIDHDDGSGGCDCSYLPG